MEFFHDEIIFVILQICSEKLQINVSMATLHTMISNFNNPPGPGTMQKIVFILI